MQSLINILVKWILFFFGAKFFSVSIIFFFYPCVFLRAHLLGSYSLALKQKNVRIKKHTQKNLTLKTHTLKCNSTWNLTSRQVGTFVMQNGNFFQFFALVRGIFWLLLWAFNNWFKIYTEEARFFNFQDCVTFIFWFSTTTIYFPLFSAFIQPISLLKSRALLCFCKYKVQLCYTFEFWVSFY